MLRRVLPAALALTLIVAAGLSTGASAAPDPDRFTKGPNVTEISRDEGAKSASGQLAQTDPSLLGSTSSNPINVMVKLDYDPVGSFTDHIAEFEQAVRQDIAAAIPSAEVLQSYRLAYGGLAVRVPANKVGTLLSVDGVAAVQKDKLLQPTDDDDEVQEPFDSIGASAVWRSLGGPTKAGEGVIVANLDTGIWPEHPMFEDLGLAPPPAPPTGTRACQFGLSGDPNDPAFACNDKLIGAQAFLNTYTTFIGAEAGEYCNKTGPASNVVCSARDADGHGTHTLTTAAGNFVEEAEMWGADWGPTSGMAPGAHVIGYRVCLDQGCFTSDSVAAVNEAIRDGADVINFSISGGNNAFTDAVELAFLTFYGSGGLANASAGNAGPGAGTANHAGPWTNTIAASYPARIYKAQLRLRSSDGSRLNASGVTITPAISTPTPVTRPAAVPGYTGNNTCNVPFAAGSVAGKIVFCDRGNPAGRADSGFNALQGGAAGMILANVAQQDLFTDLHWLPAIMVNDGTFEGEDQPGNEVRAFVATEPNVTATFTTGRRTRQTPDIITGFSSRGPLGDWIKPDVTAPGIEILAGRSPKPWPGAIPSGPPGDLYMAIAGTSMSSPHAAGVSALVKAAHPSWTPGQIKSALMTSSIQRVLKQDGVSAANPFDTGAGSIRANRAVNPTLTFDVTAAQYAALAGDPLHRIDANLPSINAPTFSGSITTTRTAMNVTSSRQRFEVDTDAPSGASISVEPRRFSLNPGQSQTLTITITGEKLASNQQYFGEIEIEADRSSATDVFIPVAFFKRQGVVNLTHTCSATTIPRNGTVPCEVASQNFSPSDADVTINGLASNDNVEIQNAAATHDRASGTLTPTADGFQWVGTLENAIAPTVDSITPGGSPAEGYLPLRLFNIAPIGGMGDETIANFNTPPFLWGDETYTRVGVTSNGYVVIGGGSAADVEFEPQTMPDPARPNNVIAPLWTDIDLSQAATPNTGARVGILGDPETGDDWLVLDYEDVATFGTCSPGPCDIHDFQIWLGLADDASVVEDVTMAHGDLGTGVPGATNAGAENRYGSSGVNMSPLPGDNTDWTINTSPPTPGGKVEIGYDAFGARRGRADLIARMTSNLTAGTTTEIVSVQVR